MEIEIKTILEVGGFCILIMAAIFIIAVLTPKMAEKVDKYLEKTKKHKVADGTDRVRGIYDLPPIREENKTEENSDKNNERGQING